jgi:transcriptional regulator with XRE-family HTH domain
MNQSGYAKLEKGGTQITIERLQQIAEIFEVDLIDIINVDKASQAKSQHVKSSNSELALSRIKELEEQLEDKRIIIDLLRNLEELKQEKFRIIPLEGKDTFYEILLNESISLISDSNHSILVNSLLEDKDQILWHGFVETINKHPKFIELIENGALRAPIWKQLLKKYKKSQDHLPDKPEKKL